MKKPLSFCLLLLCLVAANSQNTIPFQGVARDSNGVLLSNQTISLHISIHDGATLPPGTVVYEESQSVTTNNLGLFTLHIGAGTVISGTFSAINWSTGSKSIQLAINIGGGLVYTNMGTVPLQSVPYALYAFNSAGSSAGSQPDAQVAYGTGSGLTSDNGFTRDPSSNKTVIADNAGSLGSTQMRIDSGKILMTYYNNASNTYAGVIAASSYPDWGLSSLCIATVVYNGNNQILYGFYSMQDSSQMQTGGTIGGAIVGTKLYSAYMDVAMHENPNSPFNSLTVDTNGLHWEYNDTDRYAFPNADGASGQVLTTNGSGVLSFTSLPAPTPNAWNAHQVLPGNSTATDTITIQNNINNIYNPASSVTTLVINLPGSPNDGDMFILTFEAAVGSISYNTTAVGTGALTSATAGQQRTYTFDATNSKWY